MADVPSPERWARPSREPHLRAGDQDREATARVVSEAAAQGRLDLDEMTERMDRVWAARTYGDLDAVLGDLQPPRGTRSPTEGNDQVLRVVAGMGNRKQSGVWVCPPRIVTQTGVAGNVTIDFTESVVEHDVVRIEVITGTGRIVLVVPPGWAADASGVTTSYVGSVKNKLSARPEPTGPELVITGTLGLGDVIVRHPRTARFLPR
jgi:hypothetical protein